LENLYEDAAFTGMPWGYICFVQQVALNMDNIRITENKKPTTEIVHGSDKVVNSLLQIMQKAQRINICVDNTRPSLAREFKEIRDAFIDAKSRGVTIRYITEITENNVSYAKS